MTPAPRRRGEFLLVDVSNSFTKLGLAGATGIAARRRVPTPDVLAGALGEAVADWRFERVIFSSVVPAADRAVRRLAPRNALRLGAHLDLGIRVEYPHPATIGGDRLANAVAASARYGAPVVVVDFGTAVTFDIVADGPAYVGGVIAPGLALMTDYLHERTALLPRVHLHAPAGGVVGKSTAEAILSGAIHGFRGLVTEVLARVREELRTRRLRVVATGGYADLMAAQIPSIRHVDGDLTLEGLRIVALRNPRSG